LNRYNRFAPDLLTALHGDDAALPGWQSRQYLLKEKIEYVERANWKEDWHDQIFDEQGVAYTVTLIEAGPCYVTQVRLPEKEGYSSVQLGFGEANPKRLTGGQLGHLKANEISPVRYLREFRAKDHGLKVGDKVTVVDAFAVGERVDVIVLAKARALPVL